MFLSPNERKIPQIVQQSHHLEVPVQVKLKGLTSRGPESYSMSRVVTSKSTFDGEI